VYWKKRCVRMTVINYPISKIFLPIREFEFASESHGELDNTNHCVWSPEILI
jgi:hypothetical protein